MKKRIPPRLRNDAVSDVNVSAIQIMEGAALLIRMAASLEGEVARSKDGFVRMDKRMLTSVAKTLRHSGAMVDKLVYWIERGQSFNEDLPRDKN